MAAINIQRGRDHGIPPYVSWRKPCGLSPINSWKDLERVMTLQSLEKIASIYTSVEDIDLFSAGLAEKPVRGGIVGPTFACIIAQQFSLYRKGDRFWYENGNFESSFTLDQLREIRQVTFAEIICDTTSEIETLQYFVMKGVRLSNKRRDCVNLQRFSYAPWEEIDNISNLRRRFVPKFWRFEEGDVGNKQTIETLNNNNNKKDDNKTVEIEDKKTSDSSYKTRPTIDDKKSDDQTRTGLDSLTKKPTRTKRNLNSLPFIEVLNLSNKQNDLDLPNETDKDSTDRSSKRKKPNQRRKTKPKTNSTVAITTNNKVIKVKLPTPIASTKNYFPHYQYDVDNIPEAPIYKPVTKPIHTTQRPNNDEIAIIVPGQKPNDISYLINTVTKKPSSSSSVTNKPDYNIHIQINYYLNSTDKNKPGLVNSDEIYNDNPNLPYVPNHDFIDNTGYGHIIGKNPIISTTRRPIVLSTTTRRPVTTTTNKRPYYTTTKKKPYYSTTTKRPYYSTNTKRPYYSTSTERPYYYTTSKRPYVISNSNPFSVVYTQTPTKRPSVVILGEEDDPYRPFDYYRPPYDYVKRPLVGQVVKLDERPLQSELPTQHFDGGQQHSFELPHKIYYVSNDDDIYRPDFNRHPYNNPTRLDLSDKLDFSPHLTYPDFVQVHKGHRPDDEDSRFVKISSVKGHTTSTKNLGSVVVSVQQKEGDLDLLQEAKQDQNSGNKRFVYIIMINVRFNILSF